MKYLDYCYLCINNRKDSELSETPECSNCIQLTVMSMPTKFKSRRIPWADRTELEKHENMNRDTYYELREEFLNDAVVLALEKNLLRIKNVSDKLPVLMS